MQRRASAHRLKNQRQTAPATVACCHASSTSDTQMKTMIRSHQKWRTQIHLLNWIIDISGKESQKKTNIDLHYLLKIHTTKEYSPFNTPTWPSACSNDDPSGTP
jgi:hypothetical protein